MTRRRQMPLQWVSRDGKLVFLARGMHAFSAGLAVVLLVLYLDLMGLSLSKTGVFLSLGFAGGAFFTFLAGLAGDYVGRRRVLIAVALLIAGAGAVVATTDHFAVLAIAAFVGSFAAAGGGGGPLSAMEQAILPSTCQPERRTDAFAAYGIAGTVGLSLGALAAGLPGPLQSVFDVSELTAFRTVFMGYAAVNLLVSIVYTRLSENAESVTGERRWVSPLTLPNRSRILKLSGLFSVDSFAGGFIVQSLVSYWFFTEFGIEAGGLGLIFFASSVLSAVSLLTATRVAKRVGLINTMVWSHVVSTTLLVALPFSPAGWVAVLFWQVRSFFSLMDVPTRQSYIMAVVSPEERSAMAGATMLGRSLSLAASPPLATALWQAASSTVPFVVSGALRFAYDIALWATFRGVKPPEETASSGELESG